MKEKLINEYKEIAVATILLQNQVKSMEKDVEIKKEELATLNLRCHAISVALALYEDNATTIIEKSEEAE